MNLTLEKGEKVTTGKGEIGSEAGEVIGVIANASTWMAWEKSMERLVDGGWQLEKWRYFWWLVGCKCICLDVTYSGNSLKHHALDPL